MLVTDFVEEPVVALAAGAVEGDPVAVLVVGLDCRSCGPEASDHA